MNMIYSNWTLLLHCCYNRQLSTAEESCGQNILTSSIKDRECYFIEDLECSIEDSECSLYILSYHALFGTSLSCNH